MTRPSLLVPALALLALLLAAPAATAAVDPKTLPAETSFQLPTNNNLRASVEVFNDEFRLEIERPNERSYTSSEVEGTATEEGLKARFGPLGVIDVAFHPTETELDRPPKGCFGPPSRFHDGVFVGTVSFIGEGEYVRIEETRFEGHLSVWRESEWRCPRHERPPRGQRAARPFPFSPRPSAKAEDKDPAILAAEKRGCRCIFVAYSIPDEDGRAASAFFGAKFEEVEGMEIKRMTGGGAGAGAFTFNHKAGTATVRPPAPISGYGHFERRPGGPDLWRSTIRVPLLGADPIDMREGGYRARLVKDEPEFR